MSQEMVTAYVETLLENLIGNEKVRPDRDGDYPVRFRDARYYVRVVGQTERPVVMIFSVALDGVDPSAELFEAINDINTRLHFCRCFWVRQQVLFETEHLGLTIRPEDFTEMVLNVAEASDTFGPQLAASYGGRLAFDDEKGDAYEEETPLPGMYL